MRQKKKISLALQGGGAYGAFTWGVLDRFLEDSRFIIEGFTGTSAGAMNALAAIQGFLHGGSAEKARESLSNFWHKVSQLGVFHSVKDSWISSLSQVVMPHHLWSTTLMNMMQDLFSPYYWNPYNVNPLVPLAKEFFDFSAIQQHTDHKVFICATNVRTGKLKIFSNAQVSLNSLLASTCLPFLFQAVNIDGDDYWDGGFVGNPVIYPLIENCETSDIVVVQLTHQFTDKTPRTSLEILNRHKEITYNVSLMREMRAISFITKLIDQGVIPPDRMKKLNMHIIRQSAEGAELHHALTTDWAFFETLFHRGRAEASQWIDDHFQDVGQRSTADLQGDFVE